MKPKSRSELSELLVRELNACVKCGNCMAFCPLYRQVPHESANMRGKIAILQALESGRPLDTKAVVKALSHCLGCQTCKVTCPNGVNTPLVMLLGKLLHSKSLSHHDVVDELLAERRGRRQVFVHKLRLSIQPLVMAFSGKMNPGAGAFWRNLVRSGFATIARLSTLFGEIAPCRGACFSKVSTNAQESLRPERRQDLPFPNIILFPGCALKLEPVRLRRLHDLVSRCHPSARVIESEVCCGLPAIQKLDLASHSALVRRFFQEMREHHPAKMVFACPECHYQTRLIEQLYHLDEPEMKLLKQSQDLCSFLLEGGISFRRTPDRTEKASPSLDGRLAGKSLTFHDPCVQIRGLGLKHPPRQLLGKILGTAPVESYREGACCGFGQGFGFASPEAADAVCQTRVQDFVKAGVQTVCTNCPTCLDFLAPRLSLNGIAPIHLIDLAWEALP